MQIVSGYESEIATIKMNDLNTNSLDKAVLIISGTAKSMGIKVL
jgi:ribosomal protein L11